MDSPDASHPEPSVSGDCDNADSDVFRVQLIMDDQDWSAALRLVWRWRFARDILLAGAVSGLIAVGPTLAWRIVDVVIILILFGRTFVSPLRWLARERYMFREAPLEFRFSALGLEAFADGHVTLLPWSKVRRCRSNDKVLVILLPDRLRRGIPVASQVFAHVQSFSSFRAKVNGWMAQAHS